MGKFFTILADREGYSSVEDVFGIHLEPDDYSDEVEQLRSYIEWIADMSTLSGYENEEYDELVKRFDDINYKVERMFGILDKIEKGMQDLRVWGQDWKDFSEEQMVNQNESDS